MADTTHIIFGADSTLRFKLGDISLSNDLRIENPYNKMEQDGMGLLDFVSHFIWSVFLIATLFIFKSAINSLLKNVGNRIRKFNGFGVSLCQRPPIPSVLE
ncbi:hypothetical protein [Parasegetibacter sp. NRK P23]|uniref:hypothetical protein n=1 Tax=Parasegetibacter sp. NRK P23 TaxID=2942999 RepID=UPI0020433B97|nr:hypothetical protein [Parasegetibacter sp. NRK P23]MCM5530263.1 hypothetical protein [Parasegetibacter sp. NRK P23]